MLHLDADGLFVVFDELPVEAAGAPANREERRFIPLDVCARNFLILQKR